MGIVAHLTIRQKRVQPIHLGDTFLPAAFFGECRGTEAFSGGDCLCVAAAAASPSSNPARRHEIEAADNLARYRGSRGRLGRPPC